MTFPFQSAEDYSYFHLVPSGRKPTTVFGISYASLFLTRAADL